MNAHHLTGDRLPAWFIGLSNAADLAAERIDQLTDDPPEPRPLSKRQQYRWEIWRRDGESCFYCGERIPFDEATMDHVIPRTLHGSNQSENLVCACLKCNRDKGSQLVSEYLNYLDARRNDLIQRVQARFPHYLQSVRRRPRPRTRLKWIFKRLFLR